MIGRQNINAFHQAQCPSMRYQVSVKREVEDLDWGGLRTRPSVCLTKENLITSANIEIAHRSKPSCTFDKRVAELNHFLDCL